MNLLAPPRLQTDAGEGRHASWLELFFDLVFVVAIAELAHDLSMNVTPTRSVGFVLLFVPIFLVWMNYSYYADLFGDEGLDRFAMFAAMFGVGALATTLHDALAGDLRGFVVVYLLLRLLLVAMYARAWRANPSIDGFLARYVVLYGVGAFLWALALAVSGTLQLALLGAGLAIEVATPAVTYYTASDVPQQVSHMPERFGLFTIIVLGEVVVSVVAGIADTEWSLIAVATAGAAFVAGLAVWWLYFAYVREETITDIISSDDFDFWAGMGYTYGHFGVTLGIAAAGTGVLVAIVGAAEGVGLTGAERVVLGGGVAAYLLGTIVTLGAVRSLTRRAIWARAVAILVLLGVVVGGGGLSPVMLVGLLALTFGVLTAVELNDGAVSASMPEATGGD